MGRLILRGKFAVRRKCQGKEKGLCGGARSPASPPPHSVYTENGAGVKAALEEVAAPHPPPHPGPWELRTRASDPLPASGLSAVCSQPQD